MSDSKYSETNTQGSAIFSLCVLCGKRLVSDDRFAHNRRLQPAIFRGSLLWHMCLLNIYRGNTKLVQGEDFGHAASQVLMNSHPFAQSYLQRLVREAQALFGGPCAFFFTGSIAT